VTCAAGEFSVQGGTCQPCPAGTSSTAGQPNSCSICPAGTYATGGQAGECLKCGDVGYAGYLESLWDPNQSGLTSENECDCAPGQTGTNCDQAECAGTKPAVSLGFLVLEVQWPRHARVLSRNEAFSGISAAFRAFDVNSDNHLSVTEARRAIADGGMAIPLKVSHIWSRDGVKLDENDVTITDMIQDELDRLETQGTKDYHDKPSGSGEISAMTATYPNPLSTNTECTTQNQAKPELEWTVDRGEKIIFQQCAFFNGQALSAYDSWDDDVSSGDSNVDSNDCRGEFDSECEFKFQLGPDYKVESHHRSPCTAAGEITSEGSCVESPDGELVVNLWPSEYSAPIDVGACGCPASFPYPHVSIPGICYNDASYTAGGPCGSWCTLDAAVGSGCGDNSGNMCSDGGCNLGTVPTPANYELSLTIAMDQDEVFGSTISIIHLTGKDEANGLRYPGLWFSDVGRLYVARSNENSGETNAYATTVFKAGESYEIRITNIDSLLSVYVDGLLEVSTQGTSTSAPADGGVLYVGGPWYAPVKATISDVIFREVEALAISKHSYCVETKFCPGVGQAECALSLPGPYTASKGNKVGTADVTFEDYVLSFTMELAGDWSITGAWQSVFHIGDENGHRMPGIWFEPNDNRLYVNHDTCCGASTDTSFGFTAGRTYDIKVVLDKSKLVLYVDGVKLATSTGGSTPARENAAVYVADPWYDAAKVTLSDICLKEIPVCDLDTEGITTTTRCTTGLQYDGTPMDIFPRMLGKEGVSISWLDTSTVASGYRIYKYDPSAPFAEDTSARLLREVSSSTCGLTHNYLDFRDATTGSEPGLGVGYAIVPLDAAGAEIKDKVGVSGDKFALSSSGSRRRARRLQGGASSSTTSGFIVTWFGDVRVSVVAEGGGPVEKVTVKLSRMKDDGSGKVDVDETYREFLEEETDAYGEAVLRVRVQDSNWFSKTQHFRVDVEKLSDKKEGADYDQESPLRVSGFDDSLDRNGAYFPVPDSSSNSIALCNGMPRYECRDCGGYLWRSADKVWIINDESTCITTNNYAGSSWATLTGSSTDPTSATSRIWGDPIKVLGILEHDFEPPTQQAILRHLEEAPLTFIDETAVVISGTVSHAGFGAAYFAEDCPHTKFQFLLDSFLVSGTSNHQDTHGTYRQNGLCEDVPYYECVDCSSDQYIWYKTGKWHIGSDGCGSASAAIHVADSAQDLEAVSGTWQEDTGSGFAPDTAISVAAIYTRADTEECICSVDGAKLEITRASGAVEDVELQDDGTYSTAVFNGEIVTLSLKEYYGGASPPECTAVGTSTHEGRSLHCVQFTDTTGTQFVDVLEVIDGTLTCGHFDDNSCPAGYDIWVPRSYEHAKAVRDKYQSITGKEHLPNLVGVYREQHGTYPETITYAMNSDDAGAVVAGWTSVAGSPWFLREAETASSTYYNEPNGGKSASESYQAGSWISITGWDDTIGFQFNDDPRPSDQCVKDYLCSFNSVAHTFSVTHAFSAAQATQFSVNPSGGQAPTFNYKADENAEVHFLDTSMQSLSARLVAGANREPASYVNGVPVVASVARCGWELPAWILRGEAAFWLGAAAFDVRVLEADEVDEPKYYYPPGTLSNADQELVVHDCDGDPDGPTPRDEMVGTLFVSGDDDDTVNAEEIMLRGCRAKIPDVSGSAERPCATMDYTYVDELPVDRNFGRDLAHNSAAAALVQFEIISPLCLNAVKAGSKIEDLLLSPPEPLTDDPETDDTINIYGEACTSNEDSILNKGDVVEFKFELVEREPNCGADGIYPWDEGGKCNGYENNPPPSVNLPSDDHQIKIHVADGVTPEDYEESCPSITPSTACSESSDGSILEFTHFMTAGEPNPFAPFSKKISVEFTRAFDNARILFERHVLILGSIAEEVPQVWTTAVEGLIFSVLRDPPGGASTATLVEGSTISTSMAIEGAHAATLGKTFQWSASGGIQGGFKTAPPGVIFNGVGIGTNHGGGQSDSTSITVSRGSSSHFDIGISFGIAITTSDSPYLAGQPSDVIIGGGANLRFISAIEVYRDPPEGEGKNGNGEICLAGRQTVEFIPERITTYVMTVYEIEKTIERLGEAVRDIGNGDMEISGEGMDATKLQTQLTNWEKVLTAYRATEKTSVAAQLQTVMDGLHTDFTKFHKDLNDLSDAQSSEVKDFVARGIENLNRHKRGEDMQSVIPDGGVEDGGVTDDIKEKSAGFDGHKYIEDTVGKVSDSVTEAAKACAVATSKIDPTNLHPLCTAYQNIGEKVDLVQTLLGVCGFETDIESVKTFCKRDGTVPGIGTTMSGAHYLSALNFLSDTERFLTFSGSTGVDFSWDVAEARGSDVSVTTDGSLEGGWNYDGSFGFQIGRRLTDESRSSSGLVSLAGYAYPTSGPVHAVSKKLLEVTPEALAEKRRKLVEEAAAAPEQGRRKLPVNQATKDKMNEILTAAQKINTPEHEGPPEGGGCRRRLQLGIQGCGTWGHAETDSFSVSMSRSANKETGHTHTVAVSLKDDNVRDVFAVQVAMDATYGTPIFTTLGGFSSCPGETGTTRRDSGVSIISITPQCATEGCKDLEPGETAFFSVQLQNRSPWRAGVRYWLRAANGGTTWWYSGKQTDAGDECPEGDMGALEMGAVSLTNLNMRDGDGLVIDPIPYGQSEVHIFVARNDDMPDQCYKYSKIQLELYADCEDPDDDGIQEVYQYQTSMDENPASRSYGEIAVEYPIWDIGTSSWSKPARGPESHSMTFDVSWKKTSSEEPVDLQVLYDMLQQMQDENEQTAAASGGGLAAGAVFLLAVAAIGYYAYHRYHRQKTAQIEANQRQPTWDDAARANYDAIDVETHETNKEDQDTFERNVEVDVELEVQKAPPRPAGGALELSDMSKPAAYPGGQSLPPWPYPEAKPTARPTPASYDPACILKVSWPRGAARPTEDTLRETFQALAPVLNVGLGSGNAAMVVFKDAAGARAAEAAYDGPWRTAPAKPPAAAADQPPPPPKTGEV